MPLCRSLPILALLSAFAVNTEAAPIIPPKATTPITQSNVDKVVALYEIIKTADKITRGPGKNELTLLDWNDSVEIVDDLAFKRLRAVKTTRPEYFSSTRDGKIQAWIARQSTKYILQDNEGKKLSEIEIGDLGSSSTFSPDGKHLVIGYNIVTAQDPEGGGYSEVKIFDVATGKVFHTLERDKQGGITSVFSPDGKILAIGNRNQGTRLFDLATGKKLHTLNREMTQEIAFSPNGRVLATGYVDGMVGLWDVTTGKQLQLQPSGCEEIYSVDWNPKGDVLATSGRNGKIILWETEKLTKLREFEAPIWVIQARFTTDGSRLMTSSASNLMASTERKITVWGLPLEK